MPTIPKKSIGQYAPKHSTVTRRESADVRGYDARWREVRAYYINRFPLCELCEIRGQITPADVVHHRRPIADGGPIYDPDNLESLCVRCHAERHRGLRGG